MLVLYWSVKTALIFLTGFIDFTVGVLELFFAVNALLIAVVNLLLQLLR